MSKNINVFFDIYYSYIFELWVYVLLQLLLMQTFGII